MLIDSDTSLDFNAVIKTVNNIHKFTPINYKNITKPQFGGIIEFFVHFLKIVYIVSPELTKFSTLFFVHLVD